MICFHAKRAASMAKPAKGPAAQVKAEAVAPKAPKARTPKAPKVKTFNLHWGSGIVEEEAMITTEYHRPCLQLLKFTDGEAKGQYEVRFCFYDHRGGFQRSPMILDEKEFDAMRQALNGTPKLKKIISKLVR
jgi:hypothetical protein